MIQTPRPMVAWPWLGEWQCLVGITSGLNHGISPPSGLLFPASSLSVCPAPGGQSCHPEIESLRATDKAAVPQHLELIPQTGGLWTLLFAKRFKKFESVARIFQKGEFTEKSEWWLFLTNRKISMAAISSHLGEAQIPWLSTAPTCSFPHCRHLPGSPRHLNAGRQSRAALPDVTHLGAAFTLLPQPHTICPLRHLVFLDSFIFLNKFILKRNSK